MHIRRDIPTFDEARSFRLLWGKHRGEKLEDVPLTYLDWLNGQTNIPVHLIDALQVYLKNPTVARRLEVELERRGE